MKEECMQNHDQKVALKRKMEVTIETKENDMGSGTEKRARVEKKLSSDHKEKLVFLSKCLEVWLSPSIAQMEDELMRDAFLDDDHTREALAVRLDLQFQSFANFASYLLGGNLFEEIMVTTKKRWFQGALLLRYAASYMFQSSNLWSYHETTLTLVGIEEETAVKFLQCLKKEDLDLTEVGLLTALLIFTNNMNCAKEKALMQEDIYADLLSAYVDQKRQEEGHLKPNQHPGVHLGLMLDLLNQLAALPIMENHPHLTILPSNSF